MKAAVGCDPTVMKRAKNPLNCRFATITADMKGADVAMIANMNEKGRQTKLLAAIAVLAMVVCALAVVMPSENTTAVPVTPEDDLSLIHI